MFDEFIVKESVNGKGMDSDVFAETLCKRNYKIPEYVKAQEFYVRMIFLVVCVYGKVCKLKGRNRIEFFIFHLLCYKTCSQRKVARQFLSCLVFYKVCTAKVVLFIEPSSVF